MDSSPPAPDGDMYEDDLSDQLTHARILVSDAEAGILIGRAGSAIVDIKSTSGALVKISRRGQLLPGTDCRVLLISGPFHQVMDAADLVFRKVIYQGAVTLVVPDACCGGLIGKGGSVIKTLAVSSRTKIEISHYNESYGLHDRLVTVRGHVNNQLQAIYLILSELMKDTVYSSCSAGPVFLGCAKDYVPDEHVERYPYMVKPSKTIRSPNNNNAQQYLTIAIADEHIGAVIGRAGKNIRWIQQSTGAWIRTSAKGEFINATGEFINATGDREVLVSGTREAINAAEGMIMHVLSAVRSGGGDKLPLLLDTTPQQ
ncbi:hypothetical protein QYE76_044010 [Lolium multiflorum]|uniref:K Homology domain-containing protein n=1 Tax=Lolium multiflorum TaxID=4521 RepID=A0AAD8WW21_LOLMU|nr:hypothetical protein QYE76_044010 [Lolium multiflorum]